MSPAQGMLLTEGFSVEISFEALEPLQDPLIWKLIYVGEADSEKNDQVLEDIEMPINQAGSMKFVIQVRLVTLVQSSRLLKDPPKRSCWSHSNFAYLFL